MSIIDPKNGFPVPKNLALAPLLSTFKGTTNSYKFLLFRTILREGIEKNRQIIPFRDIAIGIMEEAWWPGFHFRLNFGPQDMVVRRIRDAKLGEEDDLAEPTRIRAKISKVVGQAGREELLRYVPYRFIRPWFSELQGLVDAKVNRRVAELGNRYFQSKKPLYRVILHSREFSDVTNEIELHEDWFDYLSDNLAVVKGWSDAIWLRFLEHRNPNVPRISKKILINPERESLTGQRKLWSSVIGQTAVISIFTGKPLTKDGFNLDHFLPWSFVAHNRFWNLTPIEKELNFSKSNRLPTLEFIPSLANQHAMLANRVHKLSEPLNREWRKALDDYATDLKIDEAKICDPAVLETQYQDIFRGLIGVARRMGFQDWQYEHCEGKNEI
ncbi:MAG: hypothetical protein OXE94_01600 [Aestuariivita sp.]|nr:hypothetical protein [Aestuariivita sp.]MCY4201539.1 hypothetical protein [Aestuariivita sp.]MCY4345635.1 hypothetical protein [Aestuariivita sp.]